jgi:hypothetical protein
MASGGICGALAAGALDVSRWLPEAVAALERRCALGGDALTPLAAPAGTPGAWPALGALGLAGTLAVVAVSAAVAVAGGAVPRGR